MASPARTQDSTPPAPRLNRQWLPAVLTGLLGLLIGLLIGWSTVRVAGATPASLRPDLQADYLRMVVQSFRVDLDPNLALRRWKALGPAAGPLLLELQQKPEALNPTVVTAFGQIVQALQGAAQPSANAPAIPGGLIRLIVNLVLVVGSAAAVVLLMRRILRQPAASSTAAAPMHVRVTPRRAARPRTASAAATIASQRFGAATKMGRYLLGRVTMVMLTIFLGTFVTVYFANQSGQIDNAVEAEIGAQMDELYTGWRWGIPQSNTVLGPQVEEAERRLRRESGIDLPYWPRQVAWTIKALRLDWRAPVGVTPAPGSTYSSHKVVDIILADLPHTLLLVGASFTLLFAIGIPLALYLYRKQGSRIDRALTLLAPVSSIPSWVLGVLLILFFAVQLKVLPVGGMYDSVSYDSWWQRSLVVGKHMVLPVLAVLLSLLFQCVYTWRSFFLLYAEEDYVELAQAKGLPPAMIDRRYVMRPTLPYILTNFTLLLIGFWQMTIALEKIFNWPGIGRLYITTLPNFLNDRFFPGVMPITLGIVVLFAYILGVTVLVLEIAYAIVDPQIRLGGQDVTMREPRFTGRGTWRWPWQRRLPAFVEPDRPAAARGTRASAARSFNIARAFADLRGGFARTLESVKPVAHELARSPAAIFGLTVIAILVVCSVLAVTLYPYNKLVDVWYVKALSGKLLVPRLAQPSWINAFRRDKLPASIILDSHDPAVVKTTGKRVNGIGTVTLTYTVNYPYGEPPQDILIYFDPKFSVKQPFAQFTWITPDGREIDVGRTGASASDYFDFSDNINTGRLLAKYPAWKTWFVSGGNYPTPPVDLLFADPAKEQPTFLPGTYQLRIAGVTFEEGSDLDAQFVLLGQVYGVAGTDHMRRDLIVPLLWGMPFALIFGLLGAFVTTILSMTLAAMAAWYGGWIDNLIQRLVEANMVLPIIAIGVLIYAYFNVSIWAFLAIVVLLNVFASPTKSFRAAFLQVRNAPYIEAARAYGASDARIILRYLVPRILPMFIPQLVSLIPSYVFLEATLGIFNVRSDYPTWGRTIYDAIRYGNSFGSRYWVLEPLTLLLLTGLAFAMLGFALERILNPRTVGKAE